MGVDGLFPDTGVDVSEIYFCFVKGTDNCDEITFSAAGVDSDLSYLSSGDFSSRVGLVEKFDVVVGGEVVVGADDGGEDVILEESERLNVGDIHLFEVNFLEGDVPEVGGRPDLNAVNECGGPLDAIDEDVFCVGTEFDGQFGVNVVFDIGGVFKVGG